MKDSTFVAGGVLVAALIGYGALHPPARVVAAPTASPGPSIRVEPTPTPAASRTPAGAPTSASDLTSYAARLAALTLTPRLHRTDCDRDAFGSSWRDTDHTTAATSATTCSCATRSRAQ